MGWGGLIIKYFQNVKGQLFLRGNAASIAGTVPSVKQLVSFITCGSLLLYYLGAIYQQTRSSEK